VEGKGPLEIDDMPISRKKNAVNVGIVVRR